MLLQERNRRQPSKVVRFPQQHLEDTASYSHPPSSVFCHFSVRRRSSSSAAATDSTRVRLQVSPGRPYRPLLLLPPAWNYSCGLLDLWGCYSWKFITAKKTTHVLVEPKSPPTKTLRYEKYCSLSNSRAHFLSSMGTTRTMSLPPPPFQLDTAICSSFCRHQKEWRQWWRNYNNTLPFECLWFSFK